jgi:hypothetical protein
MVEFVGFSGVEDAQIQMAYQNAAQCLNAARADAGNAAYNIALKKYFGEAFFGPTDYSKVTEVLNAMQRSIDMPSFKVVRVASDTSLLSDDRGVHATAEVYDYVSGQAPCDKLGGFKEYNDKILTKALSGTVPIKIYDEFFGLPEKGPDLETRVSTLLHELSHHAAHTVDVFVSVAAGHGLLGVKAANFTGQSQINAENYGFFVSSFGNF